MCNQLPSSECKLEFFRSGGAPFFGYINSRRLKKSVLDFDCVKVQVVLVVGFREPTASNLDVQFEIPFSVCASFMVIQAS